MTRVSESTLQRRVREGLLKRVPGASRPTYYTAASVHELVESLLLTKAPLLPDGVLPSQGTHNSTPGLTAGGDEELESLRKRVKELEATVPGSEQKIAELEAENERLRNSLLIQRQNYAALNDDLGAYTSPRLPNN